MFVGQHDRVIDAKQRLVIPSKIWKDFDPELHGSCFIAAPGSEFRLKLWPELVFKKLGNAMKKNAKLMEMRRAIFAQAARVPADSQGRVHIPERLLTGHGIDGKVKLLGLDDHLEIVQLDRWDEGQAHFVADDVWDMAIQIAAGEELNGHES